MSAKIGGSTNPQNLIGRNIKELLPEVSLAQLSVTGQMSIAGHGYIEESMFDGGLTGYKGQISVDGTTVTFRAGTTGIISFAQSENSGRMQTAYAGIETLY